MVDISDNGTGAFTGRWPPDTENLVVGTNRLGLYLQHWMARYTAKKADEILIGTPFSIPRRYNNIEGCIYDLSGEKGFVKGLRVDLQKAQTVGANTYATFQVQWGTGSDGKTGGAFAGALVRTDHVFSVGNLRDALRSSVASQTYWRIDP